MDQDKNQSNLHLIDRIKAGDFAAWAILYDRYKETLCYHAYVKLRNRDDAEDVLHEYMMELWNKRNKTVIKTNVKAYLIKAISNRSIDILKRLKAEREKLRQYLLTATDTVPYDNRLEVADLRAVLLHAFSLLPTQLRRTMEMIFMEYKTTEEAALLLNVDDRTIGKYINRAFALLKKNPQLITMYQLFSC